MPFAVQTPLPLNRVQWINRVSRPGLFGGVNRLGDPNHFQGFATHSLA